MNAHARERTLIRVWSSELRAAARERSIVRGTSGALNAGSIGTPVIPFEIAGAQEVAKLLPQRGQIGFGQAAVARDESRSEAVSALVLQAGRELFPNNLGHTSIRGPIGARWPVWD